MRPCLPLLMRARDKIADPANWGKGMRGPNPVYHRPFHTCCASEAIEDAWKDGSPTEPLMEAYRRLRDGAGLSDKMNIPRWNDAPERTHAEVLAAFDKAIEASK